LTCGNASSLLSILNLGLYPNKIILNEIDNKFEKLSGILKSISKIECYNEDIFELFEKKGNLNIDLILCNFPFHCCKEKCDCKKFSDSNKSRINEKQVYLYLIECMKHLKNVNSQLINRIPIF
jgi:hypothetical protein